MASNSISLKFRGPTKGDGPSRAKVVTIANQKVASSSSKLIDDPKSKSVSLISKEEVRNKSSEWSSKTGSTKIAVRGKTAKKVYTLPGQRYDVPEEREPLRIFYESLSKQRPGILREIHVWLMEHGMLSPERAKKAYEKKQKSQKQQRMGTPIKPSTTRTNPESSRKLVHVKSGGFKANKRVYDFDEDDDDDLIMKHKKIKQK